MSNRGSLDRRMGRSGSYRAVRPGGDPMARTVVYMSMSLDGFVGSDREHPGLAIAEGPELGQWKLERISKAGAHLMGRTTYLEMASYWPQSDDDYAAPMNDIPKVVFSKTLTDAEAT